MKAKVGELDVHYELVGPAGAPCVVFVHGLAASLEVWQCQAERFGDDFRVLRYDLRSHGGSGHSDAPCSRSDLADDLVGLLDALDIDRAAVVGHSAGGAVALQAAVDHGDRLWALGAIGTASVANKAAFDFYGQCIEAGLAEGGAAVMRAMRMKPESGPAPHGTGFAPVAEAMRTLHTDPLTDRLGEIATPTLIVVGDKDFLGVGGSVILDRGIADSELHIVPGRRHGFFGEQPDEFAAILRPFLERVRD